MLCAVAAGPNGHYYTVVNRALAWVDAKNAAAATVYNGMQGHLATISDKAENDYVASLIGINNAWLGMYRSAYGVWAWETDFEHAAVNASFWVPGEPTNGGEQCAHMVGGARKTWNDEFCSVSIYYIIEYEPTPLRVDKCPSKRASHTLFEYR